MTALLCKQLLNSVFISHRRAVGYIPLSFKANRRCLNTHQLRINKTMAASKPPESTKSQDFDYFLVLDFEATCEDGKQIQPQEIIEFPVLKVSGKTFETEATFHQYVQPMVHPQLTPFCTDLTGIVQEMVEGQPDIHKTLSNFEKWMQEEGLLEDGTTSAFVTCGDWDLKSMLPKQCAYFDIQYPDHLKRWINIKKAYAKTMGNFPRGMMPMLKGLNLQHVGRHHSGIDDCQNIAQILTGLAGRGCMFSITGHL